MAMSCDDTYTRSSIVEGLCFISGTVCGSAGVFMHGSLVPNLATTPLGMPKIHWPGHLETAVKEPLEGNRGIDVSYAHPGMHVFEISVLRGNVVQARGTSWTSGDLIQGRWGGRLGWPEATSVSQVPVR
jgi:hypothetical protein